MKKFDSIPYLKEEKNRILRLTNSISISLFVLAILVGVAYSFSDITESLYYTIWLCSPLFIVPYFLNKYGFINASRLLLALLLPIMVMFISVHNKLNVLDQGIISPVNYFDVRVILLNSIIVPFVLFSVKERIWLTFSCIPSFASLIFFDPIHNWFGVGYYQVGIESYDYYFSVNLYTAITMIFITLIMIFLKTQILKSDFRQNRESNRNKLYLNELIKLSNSININNGNIEEAKREILESAKACLGVSRISIWAFDHNKESIFCEYLFEDGKITTPGTELFAKDYPTYFVELKHQQLIIAQDARNFEATSEFTESYLKPLDIYSMMDAPFLVHGKLGGVICCEHQHEFKKWGAAESLLLKAVGDFLTYTIIVNERMHQNLLLTEKNSEIMRINDNLESIVKKRTQELEEKNKQLTEYAYINSHILRAPVARISGLYNLFRMQFLPNIDDPAICDYMGNAIEELENITLEINRAIEENGIIDREHLKSNS